ncbi:MAG: alpha-xylosidase, partial [Bacteroidota bacterium]|nr:alpha-xylosidase [Bacteroidota bacterium]
MPYRNKMAALCIMALTAFHHSTKAQTESNALLNEPVDISPDFRNFANTYFIADSVVSFNASSGTGTIQWQRNRYFRRMAFDNELAVLRPNASVVFPTTEYPINPVLPFSIQFISPRSFRVRMKTGLTTHEE